MGSIFKAAAAAVLLALLAGCPVQPEGGASHPNRIIVRDFTASPGAITLDPSFGFSLYRGSPGVPPAPRAPSVGPRATFSAAGAIGRPVPGLGHRSAK